MKILRMSLLALALSAAGAMANPILTHPSLPGFVLLPEQRYDPAVQRFLAEQSLRALPLQGGQLYYIYPVHASSAYIEQMQIRYLQTLLQNKAEDDEPQTE